jgi:hypothetical protein
MKARATKSNPRARKKSTGKEPAKSMTNKNSRTRFRDVETEWMNNHPEELRKCAGEYVIVEGTEIIAHGTDTSKLFAIAEERGVKIPFIFFVPPLRAKDEYWI